MTTKTLKPTGAGVSAEHNQQAGAGAHWQLLSDESDATHIWHTGVTPADDCYIHDALGIPPGVSISKVECYLRVKHDSSYGWVTIIWVGFRIGGHFYYYLVGHDGILDTFNTKCFPWPNNPATENPWTVAELDGAQFQVTTQKKACQAGKYGYIADIYYVVTYTPILPTVAPDPATDIEENTAKLNGNLVSDGGEACDCGFEWGETAAYGNTTPTQSKATGETFAQAISGLSPGTLYHFRAFATNSKGTAYSDDLTFTAKPEAPTNLVATAISDAQIDVSWTSGAGALNTVVRRKIGSYPTDVDDGDEAYNGPAHAFSDTGLDSSTTYYYRAWSYTDPHYSDDYAEDSAITFFAPPPVAPPGVTTESANTISQSGATSNGVLDDDGGEACDCWFEYGVPGGTIYTTPLQTKSSGELFSQALTDLTPGTRYHFRAVARNSTGITYGANMYFVTESPPLGEFTVVQQEFLELLRR